MDAWGFKVFWLRGDGSERSCNESYPKLEQVYAKREAAAGDESSARKLRDLKPEAGKQGGTPYKKHSYFLYATIVTRKGKIIEKEARA